MEFGTSTSPGGETMNGYAVECCRPTSLKRVYSINSEPSKRVCVRPPLAESTNTSEYILVCSKLAQMCQ